MIDEVALRGHLDVVERPVRPARLRIGKPPDDGDHRANEKENCRYPLPTNGPKLKSCVGWRFSCRALAGAKTRSFSRSVTAIPSRLSLSGRKRQTKEQYR